MKRGANLGEKWVGLVRINRNVYLFIYFLLAAVNMLVKMSQN